MTNLDLGKRLSGFTRVKRAAVVSLTLALLGGCSSFSATGLRCGVDADSSYVEIVASPQQIAGSTRALAELCGFAYQQEGVLRIEDAN